MKAFWIKPVKKNSSGQKKDYLRMLSAKPEKSGTDTFQELGADELRSRCDPSMFDFQTTKEVQGDDFTIGQERALKSINFGLHIKSKGFNIYVSGLPGTGRSSAIFNAVHRIAQDEPVPDDICCLFNFKNPGSPRLVTLPAGYGQQFRADMQELVRNLEIEIDNAFSGEAYERHNREIMDELDNEKDMLNEEIQNYAESKDSELKEMMSGVAVVPRYDGKAISEEDYDKLPREEKESIRQVQREVGDKLYAASRTIRQHQKQIEADLQEFDRRVILQAIGSLLEQMRVKYGVYGDITEYLEELRNDILQNGNLFKKEEKDDELFAAPQPDRELILDRYMVHVLIDNTDLSGAPVIYEQNPTYYNLSGSIEYKVQMGAFVTDHTMLRPGAVHRANGGYLIIEAQQILSDPVAWDTLKKILRYGEVKTENIAERYGLMPTAGLKPQPLAVSLKVILVGNPLIYQLLYSYDEEFVKIFKVKADFDDSLNKSGTSIRQYVSLIARICNEEKLRHCSSEAVAMIIDYSSRLAEHKQKLSAQFMDTIDLLREADYWASIRDCGTIEAIHVKEAFEERCYRSNTFEEKIQELIEENTIIIDTKGVEVGQVNGVSVIDLGDYLFGKPSRITAKTFIGPGNIINIEREAEMSGRIHSKGVLILSGYLGQTYAQDKPLAMSASICFEQHYEEIEGDSASSAELYCLLSSLSGLPLRQDLAVTGSVDQRGKIQPVGGINQKIEGFFKTCKLKGFTGTQGVLIPRSNIKHLMLSDEVVKGVRDGLFHIYSVCTIDEGLRILTGIEPGVPREDGTFPEGSVHSLVNQKLRKFASVVINFEREGKE